MENNKATKKITKSFTTVKATKELRTLAKKFQREDDDTALRRMKTSFKFRVVREDFRSASVVELPKVRVVKPIKKEDALEKAMSMTSSSESEVDLEVEKTETVAVKDYSSKVFQNMRYRAYMEDRIVSVDRLTGDKDALFCVFDGHGGSTVVDLVENRFVETFKENLVELLGTEEALNETFEEVQRQIEEELEDAGEEGSTAVVCFIKVVEGKRMLFVANLGDSPCFLVGDKVEKLTVDHNCFNKEEVARIKQEGGKVVRKKIMGTLSVTRSFGDIDYTEFGLNAIPSVRVVELKESHSLLLLGSDGVFDKLSEEEILTACQADSTLEITRKLCSKALKNKSHDNQAVIAVRLV